MRAKYRAFDLTIVEGYEEGETCQETADRIGVKHHIVYHARARLKLIKPQTRMVAEPACPRCHLRGPHECLTGDAAARREAT